MTEEKTVKEAPVKAIDIIHHCHKIRECLNAEGFNMINITSRECLESTYKLHLKKTGLAKTWRYKFIIWLMK